MYSPDVWDRNLVNLIKCGAFNEKSPVEQMSPFKWRKLVNYFSDEDLLDVFADGAQSHYYDENLNLPPLMLDDVGNKMRENPPLSFTEKYKVGAISMNNPKLNEKLLAVLKQEYTNENNSWETLQLLTAIITTIHNMMTGAKSLRNLVDIGVFMRNESDKIDYDKLIGFLKAIKMLRAAKLIGNMLTGALGFTSEEVPFADKKSKTGMNKFFKIVVHPSGVFNSILWYAPQEARATRKAINPEEVEESE